MYAASILADSIGQHGKRITTFEVTFPRMVLADMTRHRALSYSFESTRAVPVEKRIEQVRTNPFVPEFRKRAKGMGGGEALSDDEQAYEQARWVNLARDTADWAESALDLSKEHVGRSLEPYTWITGIITGTEWENYFALRCPPPGEKPSPDYPAQIELQKIAYMQETLYRTHEPDQLFLDQWHLPLITPEEKRWFKERQREFMYAVHPYYLAYASAGRCAAVSYLNHHKAGETLEDSSERWKDKLVPPAHWSPGEHPARCVEKGDPKTGNFEGWQQLRKDYSNERIRPRYISG